VDKTKPHLTVRTLLLSSVASRDPKIAAFAATVRAVGPSTNDADLTAVRGRPPGKAAAGVGAQYSHLWL